MVRLFWRSVRCQDSHLSSDGSYHLAPLEEPLVARHDELGGLDLELLPGDLHSPPRPTASHGLDLAGLEDPAHPGVVESLAGAAAGPGAGAGGHLEAELLELSGRHGVGNLDHSTLREGERVR